GLDWPRDCICTYVFNTPRPVPLLPFAREPISDHLSRVLQMPVIVPVLPDPFCRIVVKITFLPDLSAGIIQCIKTVFNSKIGIRKRHYQQGRAVSIPGL